MKKISLFLATVMFFLAVAVMPGSVQEVQADNVSKTTFYKSVKAGTSMYVVFSIPQDKEDQYDLSDIKVALCPDKKTSLNDAVDVWNVSNEEIRYEDYGQYAYTIISKSVALEKDIPEGTYDLYLFDANATVIETPYTAYTYTFIQKPIMDYTFTFINDDRYVYAYVYEDDVPDGIEINESTCPTLYSKDGKTALTSFDALTLHENTETEDNPGEKAWVYRLNVLDPDSMFGEYYSEYHQMKSYYQISENITPSSIENDNDLTFTLILQINYWAHEGTIITSPFDKDDTPTTPSDDQKPDNDNTTPDDTKQDDTTPDDTKQDDTITPDTTPSTPNDTNQGADSNNTASTPVKPEFVVSALANSSVPEVQSSINNINQLVSEIQTNPADLTNTLKAYAPDVKFSAVTSGGTLDISEKNGVDISGGTQVTFTDEKIAANVTSKDTVIVLHVKHDGTIERVPAVAGDGSITATFTSLSPVAWFKVSNAEKTTSVSPKTGEHFWSFLFH